MNKRIYTCRHHGDNESSRCLYLSAHWQIIWDREVFEAEFRRKLVYYIIFAKYRAVVNLVWPLTMWPHSRAAWLSSRQSLYVTVYRLGLLLMHLFCRNSSASAQHDHRPFARSPSFFRSWSKYTTSRQSEHIIVTAMVVLLVTSSICKSWYHR